MALYALDTDTFSLFRHGEPHVSMQILRHAADRIDRSPAIASRGTGWEDTTQWNHLSGFRFL